MVCGGVVDCVGGGRSCDLCRGAAGWEWGCGQPDVLLRGQRWPGLRQGRDKQHKEGV